MSCPSSPPISKRLPPLVAAGPSGIEAPVRIQPRTVRGRHARLRVVCMALTQLVFYGLPWLDWHGRQAVLFDLEARRFHLFDAVLFPQDLVYLCGLLIFSALLLFLATTVAGRVWCGFACPQTVYSGLFLAIERRLEGERPARLRLDAAPWWQPRKLLRRGGKHAAWLALSLLTGFSLVAWFTPARELAAALPTLALGPWEAFWLLFYGAATYVHAGLLREKVCQHACPYGRFQGAMLDAASRVVAYDAGRGEPRVAARVVRAPGGHPAGRGDCIDCGLCVQVCPVGIDIRQGLQSACISCGLCIDACDGVMDKLRAPRGLIRFAPLRADAAAPLPAWRRRRVQVYATALLLLAAAMAWGWAQRPVLRLNVMRDRAVLARLGADGAIENVYRLQLMNASRRPQELVFEAWIDGTAAVPLQVVLRAPPRLGPAEAALVVATLRLPAGPADALRAGDGRPTAPLPVRWRVRDRLAGAAAEAGSTLLLP